MAINYVEKFKRYLKEDGKSPKTIESYVGDTETAQPSYMLLSLSNGRE